MMFPQLVIKEHGAAPRVRTIRPSTALSVDRYSLSSAREQKRALALGYDLLPVFDDLRGLFRTEYQPI